jgi:hypothetical protein
MTFGKIAIWRYDVLRATVDAHNDKMPMSIIRYVPDKL